MFLLLLLLNIPNEKHSLSPREVFRTLFVSLPADGAESSRPTQGMLPWLQAAMAAATLWKVELRTS
jgi:hypothetical protein